MSNAAADSRRERLDCVFPYLRPASKASYVPDTAKFVYEVEREGTKTEEITNSKGDTTTRQTKTKELHEKKVTLKVFSQSNAEDAEHFFEAFEFMQHELQEVWTETSRNQNGNATILFNAMEKVLAGQGLTAWQVVLEEQDAKTGSKLRTWKTFKTVVTNYIVTQLCSEDAFQKQRKYMQERWMPDGMDVEDYYKRYCILNRYLPYLLTLDKMKMWFPGTDFSNWWKKGSFGDQETRSIINSRVPRAWQDEISKSDVGHDLREQKPTQTLIDHYGILQRLERRRRQPSRRTTYGRTGQRSPNYRHYYGTESRNYYGRNQNQRGIAWPNNNPGRINVYYRGTGNGRAAQQFRGSRGRFGPTSGRFGQRYRSTGRTSQQPWRRAPTQPGRWQQQHRQHTPEAYYEETVQEQTETEANDQTDDQTEQQAEESFHFEDGAATTEEELIAEWNDTFFMQSDETSYFDEADEEGQCVWRNETPYNETYDY